MNLKKFQKFILKKDLIVKIYQKENIKQKKKKLSKIKMKKKKKN